MKDKAVEYILTSVLVAWALTASTAFYVLTGWRKYQVKTKNPRHRGKS